MLFYGNEWRKTEIDTHSYWRRWRYAGVVMKSQHQDEARRTSKFGAEEARSERIVPEIEGVAGLLWKR